ncbi:hypothetical protein Hanom_Chr16g01509491 [Helianthus anomalus]
MSFGPRRVSARGGFGLERGGSDRVLGQHGFPHGTGFGLQRVLGQVFARDELRFGFGFLFRFGRFFQFRFESVSKFFRFFCFVSVSVFCFRLVGLFGFVSVQL